MIAYAWANGRIDFGRSMPKDALPIAKGPATPLRKHIEVTARHAYDGKTLLVPGVSESGGGDAAVDALLAYSREIKKRMDFHARHFGRRAVKPAGVMKVAQQIVVEFSEAEAERGRPFRAEFPDPTNPKRRLQNGVSVRVTLLRALRAATKAEAR